MSPDDVMTWSDYWTMKLFAWPVAFVLLTLGGPGWMLAADRWRAFWRQRAERRFAKLMAENEEDNADAE